MYDSNDQTIDTAACADTPSSSSEATAPRFLIIDDDEVDRITYGRSLKEGFGQSTRIDTAGDWEEAIVAIERQAHDIYLIDQNLSGGTGLDLIRRYRAHMEDCVFILFTGQDNRDIDLAATEAGAANFIPKSEITSARLERSVRFALAMNSQKRQLLDMTRALEKANTIALTNAQALEQTQLELREALSQANASEMQKRLVLDALPIAVAYVDREKRYALVNRTACEWYRKTENQIIGLSVNDAHGDDFSSLQETLEAVLQEETVIIEDLIRYPDNVSRDVKIYSAPEFGPDRQIRGWYTMTEDISERRKLENLKREFITTVSHELLTPLTSLFGSISLLRNVLTEQTSGESTQLVDIAHRNCERLMELVSDLLDMEKIETEQIEFDDAPVSIRQLVQEGVELNAAYGDRFGVTFEVAGSVPDLAVPGNRQALLQVMANLLSNAAKSSDAESRVEICVIHNEDVVDIAARDWGFGIPEEFHDEILEKFVKIDNLSSRQVPGTGLGLSICRKIVTQHNGTIGFRSKSGEGSTFHFSIPVAGA